MSQACLYCHGTDSTLLYEGVRDRLGHVPGDWAFHQCRGCGSAMLHPFPKPSDLVHFYPPVYSFNPDLGGSSGLMSVLARLEHRLFFHPQYESQTKHVLAGTGWRGKQGLRLLDVGCGRGLRLPIFQRYGFEVTGCDFQPEVIEYVRRTVGVPAVVADIDGLPTAFPPQTFDIITAFYVLEHVPNVDQVLGACWQLLRPGGWFVGAIPFLDGAQGWLFGSRWIHVTEAPRHLSLPTHPGIERACRRVGYDRIRFRPDSVLNCAGMVGSSLLPGASLTEVYGGGRLSALLRRLLGAAVTLASVPITAMENYLLRYASPGMVLAHKPSTV